jgi:DNA polymerase
MHVYNKAHTGRWAGRELQPHNMPRGVAKLDVETIIATCYAAKEAIADERQRVAVQLMAVKQEAERCGGSVADALATLFRPVVAAPPGYLLAIADFAAIEARGVAWIAGDEAALDVFRYGADPYCKMASAVYGRTISKSDKTERQLGKVIALACVAAGTPVLTLSGWKAIERVKADDLVWDGEEYVSHGGVVCNGIRDTIDVAGIRVTPDHQILTEKGWIDAWSLTESIRNLPAGRYTKSGKWCKSSADRAEGSQRLSVGVAAEKWRASLLATFQEGFQRGVIGALSGSLGRLRRSMRISSLVSPIAEGYTTESARQSVAVRIRLIDSGAITAEEASQLQRNGWRIEEPFYRISQLYRDGTIHGSKWIAKITTEDMNRAICGSPRARNSALTQGETVYDIRQCGPRNRYQAGPLIVHNCGYSMGAEKFRNTANLQGVDLAAANTTAEHCVATYRAAHPAIVRLWRDIQKGVERLLKGEGKSVKRIGRCLWTLRGGDMIVTLPSGRRLFYPQIRGESVDVEWQGKRWKGVEVTCWDNRGFRKKLYGGLLTENIVQAICRDLLAAALVRERDRCVLHVHDEIVDCVPEAQAKCVLHYLTREMSIAPEWAAGFPIKVEGFASPRYVKSAYRGSLECVYADGKEIVK